MESKTASFSAVVRRQSSQARSLLERRLPWIVHFSAWLPLIWLGWEALSGNQNLKINPLQFITLRTGKAALVMLMLTLACSPLNSLFGLRGAIKVRRTLGLYTFFYALLHVLIFFGLDYQFNLRLIWLDLSDKRYILAGAGAFLILLPLAVTSFRFWMKRLGKNWKRLHRLIYLAALLAVTHYLWLVKTDIRPPLAYAAGVLLLLALRWQALRRAAARLMRLA